MIESGPLGHGGVVVPDLDRCQHELAVSFGLRRTSTQDQRVTVEVGVGEQTARVSRAASRDLRLDWEVIEASAALWSVAENRGAALHHLGSSHTREAWDDWVAGADYRVAIA